MSQDTRQKGIRLKGRELFVMQSYSVCFYNVIAERCDIITHSSGGVIRKQRGAERSLGEQELRVRAGLGVLLHLLAHVADEQRAVLRRLPARVLQGEVNQRQLRLAVLRLLVHGRLSLALGHPLRAEE